jgi:hypothetical protein
MSIKTTALIAEATNKAAKDIEWSSFHASLPWKKLTTGGFLRWLGGGVGVNGGVPDCGDQPMHALARCPCEFGQCVPEKRFDHLLFCPCTSVPMKNGEVREGRSMRPRSSTPFFATRRFSELMR